MLLLMFLSTAAARAQPGQKVQVSVSQAGDDIVGSRLAFAVREEIRRSAAYELTDVSKSLFNISLVSLDLAVSGETKGVRSSAAMNVTMMNLLPFKKSDPQTWYPIHIDAFLLTVGSSRVDEQAKSIVADFDAAVEKFKSAGKP